MRAEEDTIFAPATAGGRAGIAVIRISGPLAETALAQLTGRLSWTPRRATTVRVRQSGGELLDRGLGLWFPRPASFTGEDVAELHLHGGRAVVTGVLDSLAEMNGLRPAEPGEFTRRAYENGKLDLTQCEALADLVAADTQEQRRQSLAQLEGALGRLYDGWRDRLIEVTGYMEAMIDFADEDLPNGLMEATRDQVRLVRDEIGAHLADGRRGERIREGFSIVLVGAPNAGKSSLLNALARRDAAIVDPMPGTTRDVIEVSLDLAGFRVTLSDTAGLRACAGRIEQEGVRRSLARAADADLLIAVFDGARWPACDDQTAALLDERTVVVLNKGDLPGAPPSARIGGHDAIVTSAMAGGGLPRVVSALGERLQRDFGGKGPALTRARHRHELRACHEALGRFSLESSLEIAAEEIRAAVTSLGRITGRVDVEEVLGTIFRQFCIGK